MNQDGVLQGLKVLDLTDERAIYGAKLLADLGADVVRPELPGGDPLRERGPFTSDGAGQRTSLWFAYFASSRRSFRVDADIAAAKRQIERLIAAADIVLSTDRHPVIEAVFGGELRDSLGARDDLVWVDTTSFGQSGPWRDFLAPDLVAGALGGAAATTGDTDTPPLKGFGELNFMVSGVYVAIAALAARFHHRRAGEGQRVDVSVHECIASCLEHVFMFYWYHDRLGREHRLLPRRGATHWTDVYDVYPGRTGHIMVTPAPHLDAQLAWLAEEDAHQDLFEPQYQDPENARATMLRLMEVMREWVSTQDAESLFFAAQARHMPYGWVLPVEELATNPQLAARDWFQPVDLDGREIRGPGSPYRFSRHAWRTSAPDVLRDAAEVLREIGWESGS